MEGVRGWDVDIGCCCFCYQTSRKGPEGTLAKDRKEKDLNKRSLVSERRKKRTSREIPSGSNDSKGLKEATVPKSRNQDCQ